MHPSHTPAKLDPDLQRAMTRAGDRGFVRALVYLKQPGGFGSSAVVTSDAADLRIGLVASLKATADRSQAPIRVLLRQQQAMGNVSTYESFWITNAIAVRARPAVIRSLAAHPSAATVRLDHWRQWLGDENSDVRTQGLGAGPGTRDTTTTTQPSGSPEWNVSRIRADEVWGALQISGTGAVVAGMDTGADWFHPALRSNYRGYNPHGPSNHEHSWFDATEGGARYPVDGHGHGTHTLGTAVGQDGIGVAPGARWIAVRVLNNQGYGYDSWIHAGFQWLLAPGGDPSQAPDVVNCSWGSENGYLRTFQDDLRALRAAGVVVVFANGNYGPGQGSVGSPASLPEAVAVGAVDQHDEVASFSARGPSPWGETRPHVVAPGVHIRSSMPGGAYGSMQGTSMAAPHVSGVAAMLRSISPTLSITNTTRLITGTTKILGQQVPNNDSGWGRVDAFTAAAALAEPGFITGTVREKPGSAVDGSAPIAGATVTAASRADGGGGMDVTAGDGTYRLALGPGIYDLAVSAFGYQSATRWGIPVAANTTNTTDFALAREPTGELRIRVRDASSERPISATVAVSGTPYQVVTHTQILDLPTGKYTVRASRLGYRVVTATAIITVAETTAVNLALPAAPSILLVDSGEWYYESQIAYYRQALDDLSYAYDELAVRDVRNDVPSVGDLSAYDVVIWSAPRDAPGYIGAGDAVASYLEDGGRLLLSGQDVGFWDGGGSGYTSSPYYGSHLKVGFVDDEAPTRVLSGEAGGIFSGQTITIEGPDGADNQDYPDVISVRDTDAAAPLWRYQGDGCGGASVGTCLNYRALYLAFGFEAISERSARREVMKRSLDWLTASPDRVGLELQPQSRFGIGPPGTQVTHTVRLRHIGQSGGPDRVNLTLQGAAWHTEISHSSPTIYPCESTMLTISVTVPTTATRDMRDLVTLTARSSLSPTVTVSATLETKAPAPVLLVDDDRWYDQQLTYRDTMDSAGLVYDVWETTTNGRHGAAPTADTLQRYPVVVWWTGYDWYAPVTRSEQAALQAYLKEGGRLLLSSQDYLYYHHDDPLAREYLGVLTYTESITPTHLVGIAENLVGEDLGPWPLQYPPGYQNWSDGVVPDQGVGVAFRDQGGHGAALTRRMEKTATVFLPFPFEAVPSEDQPLAMGQALGWLSWLGRSTFEAEPRSVRPGDTVTYTLSIKNDGFEAVTASMSNTVPLALEPSSEAFRGPGVYDSTERRLSWRGTVGPGEHVSFAYGAVVLPDTIADDAILNRAALVVEDHGIGFDRTAPVRLEAPDLSRSTFGCLPSVLRPGRSSRCTLILRNTGPEDALAATARIYAPGQFHLSEDTVSVSHGLLQRMDEALVWSGPLIASGTATLTFQLQAPSRPTKETLYGVTFLEDGVGGRWERPAWLRIEPWAVHIPVVARTK